MTPKVLIAHAEGEELLGGEACRPLRTAGYQVVHQGTVRVGDPVVERQLRYSASAGR